jgi:hypothetical protein
MTPTLRVEERLGFKDRGHRPTPSPRHTVCSFPVWPFVGERLVDLFDPRPAAMHSPACTGAALRRDSPEED